MAFRLLPRLHKTHRRRVAHRDPQEVVRVFWRTVERIAPHPHAGAPVAPQSARDKS